MSEGQNDLYSVLTALFLNAGISSGCFIAFSFLRPVHPNIYEPRVKYAPEEKKPDPLGTRLTDWIKPLVRTDEGSELPKNGMDATMFLRFVGFGSKFFWIMTIFSVPLMIIHFYSLALDNIDPNATKAINLLKLSLTKITIGNIVKGSNLLYIHAFLCYLYTFSAFYLLNEIWVEFTAMKKRYMNTSEYMNAYNNSILLFPNIPESVHQILENRLRSLDLVSKPSQILRGRDYSKLSKLVEKHLDLTKRFEAILCKYLNDPSNIPSERPKHKINSGLALVDGKVKLGCCGGRWVDSLEYFSQQLLELEEQIYSERAKSDSEFPPDHSCFVSFPNVPAAHAVAKQLHNPLFNFNSIRTFKVGAAFKLCPSFDDIIWGNIGISVLEKKSRVFVGLGITIALTIGWAALVAFTQVIADLGLVIKHPAGALLTSILGPLLASLLNVLLPQFLRIICLLKGTVSKSGIERAALYRFFLFQVYQFIVRIGVKAIKTIIESIFYGNTNQVTSLLREFMTNFVSLSTFFITFVSGGYAFYGIEILQAAPLLIKYIKKRYFVTTPREEYELADAPAFDYMPIYGFLLASFLVGISYALIAPLIVPFVALTFTMAYYVLKYQIFFVYRTEFESGGKWWPVVFNILCVCILCFQLSTFGALVVQGAQPDIPGVVNSSKIPNLLIFPLPFITLAFWGYIHWKVRPKTEFIGDELDATSFSNSDTINTYDSLVLKNKAYNPAVFKLLPKVWVRNNMKEQLAQLYTPEYKDVVDYVAQKYPERLNATIQQEANRQIQRDSTVDPESVRRRRKMSKMLHEEKDIELSTLEIDEIPPEMEK